MDFMPNLGWPVIVNILSAALLALLGIIFKVVPKLTKSIANTISGHDEIESVKLTGDSEVDNLIAYLQKGCHSFDWLRKKPEFANFTNERFEHIIKANPKWFKRINIIHHDDSDKRLLPSNPGMKLRPEAITKINEET